MQIKIFLIGILIACSYLIGEFIYQAYTKRHRERDDEMLRLEAKIEEDEKFIKFLKELVGE